MLKEKRDEDKPIFILKDGLVKTRNDKAPEKDLESLLAESYGGICSTETEIDEQVEGVRGARKVLEKP